jgi:hypothetical protein
MTGLFQDDEEGEYTDYGTAQKVFQEIRCAYLQEFKEINLPYFTRLNNFRSIVEIAGEKLYLCFEYDETNRVKLPSNIPFVTGNYDKTQTKWAYELLNIKVPENFKYKYTLGGLTIYANNEDLQQYLNPSSDQLQSDFNKIWSSITTETITHEEFSKLKSIAACATQYMKAKDRYELIKCIANAGLGEKNEDFILDLFETSAYSDDLDEFLGYFSTDATLLNKLYHGMDNAGVVTSENNRENNKDRFLRTLYILWKDSKYSNPELYNYGKGSSRKLVYEPKGFYRSWAYNYEFTFISNKIIAKEESQDDYDSQIEVQRRNEYELFQPIELIIIDDEDKVLFPAAKIPAFYLRGIDEKEDWTAIKNHLNLQADIALTLTGFGNLAHLKKTHKGYQIIKGTLALIEITSSVADIMMNYTSICNGEEEFCNELRKYTFWLQIASASGDLLVTRIAKRSGKKVLDNLDQIDKTKINASNPDIAVKELKEHLEEVVGIKNIGSIDNLLDKLNNYENLRDWVKSFDDVADKPLITRLENLSPDNLKALNADINADGLKKLFRDNSELIDAWGILNDAKVSSIIKRNTANLEIINNLRDRVNKVNLYDAFKNSTNPQKLIDDLGKTDNFYSGKTGIEISIDASTDKIVISRKTLNADIQDIANLRTKYTAGKKKNIATGKGEIGGEKIDLESVSGEVTPENYAQKGNFQPSKENHYQGRLGYENHTEQKIVEYLRERFKNDFNVNGTIEIASERPYCRNCIDIVDQFQAEFKNITVIRVEVLPKF